MKDRRVLIVDDDALLRKILERTFAERGWQCAAASNAEVGWELVHSIKPDLLVLDIFLPGKWSGLDMLRLLKVENQFPQMAVVMVTAGDPGKYAALSREAGANILIPKPFSPKSFMVQVEDLFSEKEAENE